MSVKPVCSNLKEVFVMSGLKESKGDKIFLTVNMIAVTILMLAVLYPLIYILS